jgi:hypothetical protein
MNDEFPSNPNVAVPPPEQQETEPVTIYQPASAPSGQPAEQPLQDRTKMDVFFNGGTNNVSLNNQITKAAWLFFGLFIVSIVFLLGLAWLHVKVIPKMDWLSTVYWFFAIAAICNIIFFGWIRRELLFGMRGAPLRTVRGGAAVGMSFIYLFGIGVVIGGSYAYWHAGNNTNQTPDSAVQSSAGAAR